MVKRICYLIFLPLMLVSCEQPISEFQSANFIKFFGSGHESKGNDVIELSDGGYVITGYDIVNGDNKQIFTTKVDENGNLMWSNTYGNSDSGEEGKIVKAVNDGFLIAGTSLSNTGITRSFILKTNVDGVQEWLKLFGDSLYNIVVNDIFVGANDIYVAGHSDVDGVNKTDYFAAKLNLFEDSVHVDWYKINFPGTNSTYEKVFLKGDSLIIVGTDGANHISITTLSESYGGTLDNENTQTPVGTASDVYMNGASLFILANNSSVTQLSKLNPSHIIEWQTEPVSSVSGKTFAYNDDGTIMICGESLVEGNTLINFIKVDGSGNTEYGAETFRTFQGTVSKVMQTNDKGLILVGTTNPTFGAMVQLIKTDKDYFMLKN